MVGILELEVGKTRVRDVDGFCGTLNYLGPVASAKNETEVYAGIAWDDPSRGKHDGSVICRKTKQLIRHFSCISGSFVRLAKLDIGIPLDEATILTKYVETDAPLVAPGNLLRHTVRTSSGKEKPIEFHGEEKLREHQKVELLSGIAFRNMGISSIFPNLSCFQNILDLDLGGNLICDWRVLADIIRSFPNLTALSLASNRVGDMEVPPRLKSAFLKILNLHSCGMKSLQTIQCLDSIFPALEELCVAYNDLSPSSLTGNLAGFRYLTRLDLSSCNLSTWEELAIKLADLGSLETLLLCDNSIKSIVVETRSIGGSFSKVRDLNLTGASMRTWQDLEGLQGLPALKSLTVRNTPLIASMGAAEARFLLIARFPNLDVVNSSPVSAKERSEAERRYVAQVTHEIFLASADQFDRETFLTERHPQFARLAVSLQKQMDLEGYMDTEEGISSYTVNITITSLAANSCHIKPICKRLPSSLQVKRLKALCAHSFGLDVELQVLYYRTEVDAFPVELNDGERDLGFYGIRDGGEILLNERDVEARHRKLELGRMDHQKRMQVQEEDASAMQGLRRRMQRKI